jgi:hypothetical protein
LDIQDGLRHWNLKRFKSSDKLGSGFVTLKELIFWGVKLGCLEGGKRPSYARPGLLAFEFSDSFDKREKTQSFT